MLRSDFNSDKNFNQLMQQIIVGILNAEYSHEQIRELIRKANGSLVKGEPIDLRTMQIRNNDKSYSLNDYLSAIQKLPQGKLLLAAMKSWGEDNKVQLPDEVVSLIQSVIVKEGKKEVNEDEDFIIIEEKRHISAEEDVYADRNAYLDEDNNDLYELLQKELGPEQVIGDSKSAYAWKFKSGQDNLDNKDVINLFFLGTSTPPLFGIHNVDVAETGHIICQLALQKAKKGEPTLLVKGIATANMGGDFPLSALKNPNIQGVSNSNFESVQKTLTTVKGTGAEKRVSMAMEQYFIPNLFKMITEKPLQHRQELMINLAGHSRGGITTFIAADCINQFIEQMINGKEGVDYDVKTLSQMCGLSQSEIRTAIQNIKDNQQKIKMKLCALDPVEGARSMADWSSPFSGNTPKIKVPIAGLTNQITCSYESMPERLSEACVFFASDERRSGFRPTIPSFSDKTKVVFKRAHGKHGGMTGNFGNDGNAGQFKYKTFGTNKKLQQAMIGIFDETLLAMNEFLSTNKELPCFPRNTLRRIFRQPEYANTKGLLLDVLSNHVQIELLNEKELILNIEKMMHEFPAMNFMFYEALHQDAEAAIENHKKELLSLETEWRQDTNIGTTLDRDAWHQDRKVYVRGKKVKGSVKWHEFDLEEMVPTRLPEVIYHGVRAKGMLLPLNKHNEALLASFYQFKNKIEFLANTSSLSLEEKRAILFGQDFDTFLDLLDNAAEFPENKEGILAMITELMIDLDYQYQLVEPGIAFRFQKVSDKLGLEIESLETRCADIQLESIIKYLLSGGINKLSFEETKTLINHVKELHDRVQYREKVDLSRGRISFDKYDDIALGFSSEQFLIYQRFLAILEDRLELKAELDQYIDGIEAYIESKQTVTGQDTREIEELLGRLKEVREKLNTFSNNMEDDAHAQRTLRTHMQSSLRDYKEKKGFQGYVAKYVKQAPGSVLCIQAVEESILNRKALQEMKREENLHQREILQQDLDTYMETVKQYIESFKWGKPEGSAGELLLALQALKEKSSRKQPSEVAEKMKRVVENYINDNAHKLTPVNRGYLVSYATSYDSCAAKILQAKEELQKKRLEIVKAKLMSPEQSKHKM
ncbi:MAG: hypothetical protein BGO43_14415 [Gammaproteobacteria bacterium 39-13]|nr:hypothetical protein [Gammaproteobacteria bacterium]OJV88487.1 MAG: hypothetical protein BGO43_14415 [Gammaproteobacteria bacterium 39-13]